MWVSVGMMMAAALAGQEPPTEPAPDDTAAAWGFDLYAERPRLTLAQRMEQDCAEAARPADEDEAACRERITEAVIQDSLSRGNTTQRVPEWTEENEREWVQAPRRNPIDRLRDCRQSSQRSQDGERSSWSVRCGDQDGPAAQALDRLLRD